WGRLLPTGLERDFLVLIDRKVVAAVGVLLRFGRPIRRAARVAVVEDLACWWRGRRLGRDRRGHAGRQTGVPIATGRARRHAEHQQDCTCKSRHGVPPWRGTRSFRRRPPARLAPSPRRSTATGLASKDRSLTNSRRA